MDMLKEAELCVHAGKSPKLSSRFFHCSIERILAYKTQAIAFGQILYLSCK